MVKQKRSRKLWAVMLTLAMALTMMLSSVTAFAGTIGTGPDSLVTQLSIGGVNAQYHSFTEGSPAVTRYFFDASLSTSDLTNLSVYVELSDTGTIVFNGQTRNNVDDHTFTNVNMSTGKTLTVTIGSETREYRVTASGNNTMTVYLKVNTDQASTWATANPSDPKAANVAAGAAAVKIPNSGVPSGSIQDGFLIVNNVASGSSVMDVLDSSAAANSPIIKFNGTNFSTASTTGGSYVGNMITSTASLGDPYYDPNSNAGPNSGWMYWVDDELPMFGAADYTLNSGQFIEWKYIQDWTTIWS